VSDVVRLVPQMDRLTKAAFVLADFAIKLRAIGVQSEAANLVLENSPHHHTRSGTMAILMEQRFNDALKEFDELAAEYIAAKVAEIGDRTP
jgi:hypothetical protein